MKNPLSEKNQNFILLSLILIVAISLRFYGLTNQSMWVDELHTMVETDPSTSWGKLFDYLRCCDPHPPLYFICVKILFSVFGHTEGIARGLSAICGVVSVWSMYLLGKEVLNQRLGIIAAWLTCVNYYNIYYSQEARCYIMAFLFTVFSFIYFIRLIRGLQFKNVYLYSLFTLLLLYSHYYSLFIVAAQALIAFILMFGEKENRKTFLKTFAVAGAIIGVGFLPWVPFVLEKVNLTSFWISPPEPSFAISYFSAYFGHNDLLKPILVLLLFYYCYQVFSESNKELENVKESPLQLSFFISFIAIGITYVIPYVRSLIFVPMLFDRYTIVVVPIFLLAIAFGISLIRNRTIHVVILSTILFLSFIDLSIAKKYYSKSKPIKTQFREMTEFISGDGRLYPIIEERTAWQHGYYLKKYNYNATVFAASKEAIVDSILLRTSDQYKLNRFWIVGAHGFEAHLNPQVRQKLDNAYTLVKEKEFYDAWAQLFVAKSLIIDVTSYFDLSDYGGMVIPIWGGIVTSRPMPMQVGRYTLKINHRGTKASNIYPHLVVLLDDKKRKESLELFEKALSLDFSKHDEIFDYAPELQNDAEILTLISSYKK